MALIEMDELDRRAAKALSPSKITYLPGSYNKRFASSMAALASQADSKITAKQKSLLWSYVWRYRRQIRDREVLNHVVEKRQ